MLPKANIRHLLVLIPLTGVLGACGSVWNKPGTTPQEFQKDDYECKRDAKMAMRINWDLYNQCMQVRGYRE